MTNLLHKAIAIPFIDTGQGDPKFLIVRDKRFREWTFVTGGCRIREVFNPLRCAIRELEEETRGLLSLKSGSYGYFKFYFEFNSFEKAMYHVYIFPLKMTENELETMCNEFDEQKIKMDNNYILYRKNYDENDKISFKSLTEFKNCESVWKMIYDMILNNKEFYDTMSNKDFKRF